MKVQPGNVNSHLDVGKAKGEKVDAKTVSKEGRSPAGDVGASAKVNISEQAQMINKIKEMATPDMNEVREDKVAHFQNLIDKGEYEFDAASVADRMIDQHLIR